MQGKIVNSHRNEKNRSTERYIDPLNIGIIEGRRIRLNPEEEDYDN
jgi:hypothetical protein